MQLRTQRSARLDEGRRGNCKMFNKVKWVSFATLTLQYSAAAKASAAALGSRI